MKTRATMIATSAVLVILALAETSILQAETINFNGGYSFDPTDWLQPDNWDLGTVPGSGNTAIIGTPHTVSLSAGGADTLYELVNMVVASGGSLTIEDSAHLSLGGTGFLSIVTGGTLTLSHASSLHKPVGNINPTGNSTTININGGQLLVDGVAELFDSLTVNVTAGGLLKAGATLYPRRPGTLPGGIFIDGGTVVARNLDHRDANAPITFVLDDPVGKLILTGASDHTAYIQGLINDGRIINGQVAWGEYSYYEMGVDGSLTMRSGSGTIITAIPEPGTIALLALAGLVMLIRRRSC